MYLQLFAQEKREAPTQRRRQDARRKGQGFRSNELSAAFSVLVVYSVLRLSGSHMAQHVQTLATRYWGQVSSLDPVGEASAIYADVLLTVGVIMWPIALAVVCTGLAVGVGQSGLNLNLTLISPKFERLNPVKGAQKLFSRRTLVEGLKAVLKVSLVGFVVWTVIRTRLDLWPQLASFDPLNAVAVVIEAVSAILLAAGFSLLVLGATDYGYQWWEHEQSLRMTRQELKEEMKDVEGKPEVKSAVRSRQRQLARSRMMAAVPEADVVVTNPIHFAVALKYDLQAPAPQLVAKGQELLAKRIVDMARSHEIMIVTRPELARALYRSAEVGAYIPADLYQAVAEVLAFVYRARGDEGVMNR